jgi:hypothetical protein
MVTKSEIIFHDGSTLQDAYNSGVTVCTAATKPSSPFEGQVIYVTDNTVGLELEAYDGAAWQTVGSGLWESVSSKSRLKTAQDIDMQGKKVYLYNTGTDSTSMYIERDSTSGNMIFHIPTGEAVEWTVG